MEVEFIVCGSGPGAIGFVKGLESHKDFCKWRILIVERGRDQRCYPETYRIDGLGKTVSNEEILLERDTVQQTYSGNRTKQILEPNIVGGGSSVNGMVWTQGPKSDFCDKNWGDYTFESIQEAMCVFNKEVKSETHYNTTLYEQIKKNATCSGFKELSLNDIDSGNLDGIGQQRMNVRQGTSESVVGKRKSMYESILEPMIKKYKNIKLMTEHEIKHVIFKKDYNGCYLKPFQPCAVKVKNLRSGQLCVVNATKEVVICAGVFGSPEILVHSGIGPKKQLLENQLPCIIDQPNVGCNLTDQVQIRTIYHLKEEPELVYEDCNGIKYTKNRSGPVKYTLLATVIGFFISAFIQILYTDMLGCSSWILNCMFVLAGIIEGTTWGFYGIDWWFIGGYITGLGTALFSIWFYQWSWIYHWWFSVYFWSGYIIGFLYSRVFYRMMRSNFANQSLSGLQLWTFGKRKIQLYFLTSWVFDDIGARGLIYFQYFKSLEEPLRSLFNIIVKVTFLRYLWMKNLCLVIVTTRLQESKGSYYIRCGKWHIDPNYLGCKEDEEDLMEGFRLSQKLMGNLYDYTIQPLPYNLSDSDVRLYVKKNAGTTYHFTGTTVMGLSSKTSVTNSKNGCTVWETNGLRVVGSSSSLRTSTSNQVVCGAIGYITAKYFVK